MKIKLLLIGTILLIYAGCIGCEQTNINQQTEGKLEYYDVVNTPETDSKNGMHSCSNGTDYFYLNDSCKTINKVNDSNFAVKVDSDCSARITSMAATNHFLYYVVGDADKTTLHSINILTGQVISYDFLMLNNKDFEIKSEGNQLFLFIEQEDLLYTFSEEITDQSDMVLLNSIVKENGQPVSDTLNQCYYGEWLIVGYNDGTVRLITDIHKTRIIYQSPNDYGCIIVSQGEIYSFGQNDCSSLLDDTSRTIEYAYQLPETYSITQYQENALCEGKNIIWNQSALEYSGSKGGVSSYQKYIKYDLLLSINLETLKNEILYQTSDYKTRIVGYKDNAVILYDTVKQQIMKHTLSNNSDQDTSSVDSVLTTIDKTGITSITLEWCNDVLFVYDCSANEEHVLAIVRLD